MVDHVDPVAVDDTDGVGGAEDVADGNDGVVNARQKDRLHPMVRSRVPAFYRGNAD